MPSGPVPDHNRGPGFLAEVTITTVAALVTVALRFYVRTHIVHALGWDDWIILLSMVKPYDTLAISSQALLTSLSDFFYHYVGYYRKTDLPRLRQAYLLCGTTSSRADQIQHFGHSLGGICIRPL